MKKNYVKRCVGVGKKIGHIIWQKGKKKKKGSQYGIFSLRYFSSSL